MHYDKAKARVEVEINFDTDHCGSCRFYGTSNNVSWADTRTRFICKLFQEDVHNKRVPQCLKAYPSPHHPCIVCSAESTRRIETGSKSYDLCKACYLKLPWR